MTPKEKAEQLNSLFIDKETVKLFISQVYEEINYIPDYNKQAIEIMYWNEVKQELEKL
jgi:hypothetical protein